MSPGKKDREAREDTEILGEEIHVDSTCDGFWVNVVPEKNF